MEADAEVTSQLKVLFRSQKLGVLSTHDHGQPYASLVAFAATDDMKGLLFATSRSTRKYANLRNEPRAAMLVDNRSNQDSDFHNAIAVTATGQTVEVAPDDKDALLKVYLDKLPHLAEFVCARTCALFLLTVDTYYVVQHFQHVVEIHIER